jgi:predicted lysophospholipase L1 biosynthesis ABC-type transport system permease subunit
MSFRRTMKREVRVALSRRAQPVWFRVLKWVVIVAVLVLFRRTPYLWLWIIGAIALALSLHMVWRWKTKGWTRPWGGWDDTETAGPR